MTTYNIQLFRKACICLLIILMAPAQKIWAQMELKPWGNLDGIRIKGQLMEFNTRFVLVGQNWKKISFTGKELQKPQYSRNEKEAEVNTQMGDLQFVINAKDEGGGEVILTIKSLALKDTIVKGIYFNVSLPEKIYNNSPIKIDKEHAQLLDQSHIDHDSVYFQSLTKRFSLSSTSQKFELQADTISKIMARLDRFKKNIQLYILIYSGKLNKGTVLSRTYRVKVSGQIDQSTATLKLDTSVRGRPFAGLGGNFRIQNPKLDPQVINYCLENMRVAWGRVEMPWSSWQPDSAIDPSAIDTSGQHVRVRRAMQMAQKLSRMNIPIVLTAWFPPAWAAKGKLIFGKSPQGIWGNPLNKACMPMIYKSITNYIIYLKNHYGVDVKDFSFNESDLGINVRQTAEEHDELIKGLGGYFLSRGLKTKLLLGDNSDASSYKFVYPAMNDPLAHPYIGAVSFHSWRGWDNETLQKWADIAKQTRVPLIVGEGSIDAAAWSYPKYFEDPSYALEEINLYTRLLAICQPESILQWQLTSDYSPLKGGGIFGDNSPLGPTQRFWNLKQLASTPKDLYYMSLTNDNSNISSAALGDNAKHIYAIHLVNNSTSRKIHLTGIPASVKEFSVYVTSEKQNMNQSRSIMVINHEAFFDLDGRSFTTLVSR